MGYSDRRAYISDSRIRRALWHYARKESLPTREEMSAKVIVETDSMWDSKEMASAIFSGAGRTYTSGDVERSIPRKLIVWSGAEKPSSLVDLNSIPRS